MPASPGTTQKNPDPTRQDEAAQDVSAEVEQLVRERTEELRKENDVLRRENTHLRRTETILRESEAKYRVVADFTYDWEEWIDPEGSFVYVSPSCERITGYSVADFTADPMLMQRIIHPEDQKVLKEHTEEFHANETEPANIDFRIVTKSREIRWISHYCQPVYSAEGVFRGRRGSNRDITKRKQAEEALRKAYAELDDRVRERTAELEHANTRLQIEIEERKQTGEALRESEEKYRHLFESMGEGFALHEVLCDPPGVPKDYRFLDVNPAFERLTGLQRDALLGKRALEVLPDLDRAWIDRYGMVALTGESIHFELYSTPLQKYYDVYVYSPARGFFATFFRDITERKKAEEALQESEEKLRTLFDSLPIGISVLDTDRKMREVNPALGNILDIAQEDLLQGVYTGRRYLRSDGTEMPMAGYPSVRAFEEQKAVHNVEIGVVKEDGTTIWTNVSAVPLPFSDWSVLVTTADITERKRAEEALSNQAALLNLTHDTIMVRDMENRITFWNQGAEERYGWTRDEAVGQVTHELLQTQFPEPPEEIQGKLIREERWEGELVHTTREGRQIVVASRWALQRNKQGNPVAILEINNDITDRRRAEEALKRRTDDLVRKSEEVEAARDEANMYLDIMTHDVRNANNVSSMYADLLVELLAGDQWLYARKLRDAIRRSSEILQNVATIRRLQQESDHLMPVNLDAVIKEEIGNFPGLSIRYDSRRVDVLANGLISTVFNNLIGNAVKFGGPDVEITIRVEQQDGEVLVMVADTGPGIPDEIKAKLFHRFERGMAKGKGEGLGLFIVRTLVERYGGRVWIEDRVPGRPEEGTAFRFTLRKVG